MSGLVRWLNRVMLLLDQLLRRRFLLSWLECQLSLGMHVLEVLLVLFSKGSPVSGGSSPAAEECGGFSDASDPLAHDVDYGFGGGEASCRSVGLSLLGHSDMKT